MTIHPPQTIQRDFMAFALEQGINRFASIREAYDAKTQVILQLFWTGLRWAVQSECRGSRPVQVFAFVGPDSSRMN